MLILLTLNILLAQNGKWNVDPYATSATQRQERIDACFRDAPITSARNEWLDKCLREAR
jgi:hypothetical protein